MQQELKSHPIIEGPINAFGDWLKHRRDIREMRNHDCRSFDDTAPDLAVHPIEISVRQLRPVVPEQGPKNLVHRSISRAYFCAASRLAVSFRSRIT